MSVTPCQVWLTCEDGAEAKKLAKHLLDNRLIVCAKQVPISSDYWWGDNQECSNETLLIMESAEEKFDAIEAMLEKLHSYEAFVLQIVPIKRLSRKANTWLTSNLDSGAQTKGTSGVGE